jgi:hypothetical protein
MTADWKIGDTCFMITNKKRKYTREYTIVDYDGQFYGLHDKNSVGYYRARVNRLFRSREEAVASLEQEDS